MSCPPLTPGSVGSARNPCRLFLARAGTWRLSNSPRAISNHARAQPASRRCSGDSRQPASPPKWSRSTPRAAQLRRSTSHCVCVRPVLVLLGPRRGKPAVAVASQRTGNVLRAWFGSSSHHCRHRRGRRRRGRFGCRPGDRNSRRFLPAESVATRRVVPSGARRLRLSPSLAGYAQARNGRRGAGRRGYAAGSAARAGRRGQAVHQAALWRRPRIAALLSRGRLLVPGILADDTAPGGRRQAAGVCSLRAKAFGRLQRSPGGRVCGFQRFSG
jgi:hypothetical protein